MNEYLSPLPEQSDVGSLNELLPGFHCGACGEKRCDAFAEKLANREARLDSCVHLKQEKFRENRSRIMVLLERTFEQKPDAHTITGVIDSYEADFILKPLPGEPSCREVLFPFSRREFKAGDVIRYRPLGCPVIHFARILEESNGLITVHMIGPGHRLKDTGFTYEDVGVCMVGGFEGIIDGKLPFVGQTVRFLPAHCMMQKVHSGVVVQLVGRRVILEGIDLKVWAPPIPNT